MCSDSDLEEKSLGETNLTSGKQPGISKPWKTVCTISPTAMTQPCHPLHELPTGLPLLTQKGTGFRKSEGAAILNGTDTVAYIRICTFITEGERKKNSGYYPPHTPHPTPRKLKDRKITIPVASNTSPSTCSFLERIRSDTRNLTRHTDELC